MKKIDWDYFWVMVEDTVVLSVFILFPFFCLLGLIYLLIF